jgi:Ca-activated chloride channel family protein
MMLPILIVLFALLLTQADAEEKIFAPRVLARLRVDTKRLSSRVRNLFYFLMFLFIILALAGPVVEEGMATVRTHEDRFLVALDISDSMLCEDLYPNRLELSKRKLIALLQEKEPTAAVGLLAFAKESFLLSPPTHDHRTLAFFVRGLQSSSISAQGTNILTLLKAAERLFSQEGRKRLLIISDGGEKRDFSREIAFAKANEIEVYILGVGTDLGAPLRNSAGSLIKDDAGRNIVSRINRKIAVLAEESGGRFVRIEDLDIPSLLQWINGAGSDQTEKEKPIYVHLFVFFIAAAMVMLLLATSSFTKGEHYRLPVLLLMLLFLQPLPLKASLFDYRMLDDARESYTKEAYGDSARAYHRYGIKHSSAEAIYNEANALYRAGRFQRAVNLYESIRFVETQKNHSLYHNLGNALARLGTRKDLEKAVEAYRRALTYQEDVESRENLARVEALLQNRKEQMSAAELDVQPVSPSPGMKNEAQREKSQLKNGEKSSTDQERPGGMSEREAEKWLKRLDLTDGRHGYKIEVADPEEGGDDAKPW